MKGSKRLLVSVSSHSDVFVVTSLLRCGAVSLSRHFPTFRKIVAPSSSSIKQSHHSFPTALRLMMKAPLSFETSASNGSTIQLHIPEEFISQKMLIRNETKHQS